MWRGCGVASAMLLVLAARCCGGQQFERRGPPASVLHSREDFHLHHGGIDGETVKRAMKHKFKSWNTRNEIRNLHKSAPRAFKARRALSRSLSRMPSPPPRVTL